MKITHWARYPSVRDFAACLAVTTRLVAIILVAACSGWGCSAEGASEGEAAYGAPEADVHSEAGDITSPTGDAEPGTTGGTQRGDTMGMAGDSLDTEGGAGEDTWEGPGGDSSSADSCGEVYHPGTLLQDLLPCREDYDGWQLCNPEPEPGDGGVRGFTLPPWALGEGHWAIVALASSWMPGINAQPVNGCPPVYWRDHPRSVPTGLAWVRFNAKEGHIEKTGFCPLHNKWSPAMGYEGHHLEMVTREQRRRQHQWPSSPILERFSASAWTFFEGDWRYRVETQISSLAKHEWQPLEPPFPTLAAIRRWNAEAGEGGCFDTLETFGFPLDVCHYPKEDFLLSGQVPGHTFADWPISATMTEFEIAFEPTSYVAKPPDFGEGWVTYGYFARIPELSRTIVVLGGLGIGGGGHIRLVIPSAESGVFDKEEMARAGSLDLPQVYAHPNNHIDVCSYTATTHHPGADDPDSDAFAAVRIGVLYDEEGIQGQVYANLPWCNGLTLNGTFRVRHGICRQPDDDHVGGPDGP